MDNVKFLWKIVREYMENLGEYMENLGEYIVIYSTPLFPVGCF